MKKIVLMMLFLFIVSSLVFSDGVVFPLNPIETEPNPFVMLSHEVDITIKNRIADVSISEVFWNDSQSAQRVVYLFPLPDRAVINNFQMVIGGETYQAQLLERDEAKQQFKELMKKNKDPALLEFMDESFYKLEIDAFQPGEKRTIELSYTQELGVRNGLVELTYPLKIDGLLKGSIRDIVIRGSVEDESKVVFIDSPTNKIETSLSRDGKKAEFTFKDVDYIPNNDFSIKYGLGERQVEAFMTTDIAKGDYNTFLLEIYPDISIDTYQPKDIVFILDKSGSMSGRKYRQAQDAAEFVLKRLRADDRFNLVLFNHAVEEFDKQANLLKSDSKEKGINWISMSSAGGNTNLYESLHIGLSKLIYAEKLHNPIVLFLTDGLPTAGIQDPEKIVGHTSYLGGKIDNFRLFAFGVGYDVNTYILDLLASNNNGDAFYVTEEESIETAVSELYSRISSPILSDAALTFESGTVEIIDFIPSSGLTVYKNEPLKIYGRYRGEGKLTVKLTGKMKDSSFSGNYHFNLSDNKNPSVSLLWAGRRINQLLNSIRVEGEREELVDEVIALSKQYSIPTPYTSYLVSSEEPMEQKDAQTFSHSKTGAPTAPQSQTGKSNVKQSKQMGSIARAKNEEQVQELLKETQSQNVRVISGKVFHLEEDENAWVDEAFVNEETITVDPFSDLYFDLIEEHPELKEILQLGEEIRVKLNGTNYIF